MERILRVRDFVGVVVPSVVSDVLSHLTELPDRFIENTVFVLGNLKLYLDVSGNLHTSSVESEILKPIFRSGS